MEHFLAFRRPEPFETESCVEPQHSKTSSPLRTILTYGTAKEEDPNSMRQHPLGDHGVMIQASPK
jgi:hypothetical protein